MHKVPDLQALVLLCDPSTTQELLTPRARASLAMAAVYHIYHLSTVHLRPLARLGVPTVVPFVKVKTAALPMCSKVSASPHSRKTARIYFTTSAASPAPTSVIR